MRIFRRFLALGTLALLVVGAAMSLATPSSQAHAQANDPEAVMEQFVDALNADDLDAAMAVVADDVSFTLIDSFVSQAGFGKPAFAGAVGQGADVNRVIELTEVSSEGNVVTGVSEITDDECEDRYLQPFTITVNEAGLITRAEFTHDETDAQTLACLESLPQLTEPPAGAPTIAMGEQSDSNQTGVAVNDVGDITIVGIFIEPGAEGVLQPAHIHTGTCEAPGPIVQPLASVLNGVSVTYISELPAASPGQGLVINVHLSDAQAGVYVSCGVIEAAAPAASTPTAAAGATATPAAGVSAPDTGNGPGARTGLLHGWGGAIAMLVLVGGLVAVGVGVLMRRAPSTSRRRAL